MEELQTGALVFLVDDGNGHIIDAVGVPSVVSGEIRSIGYYGDGILILQQLSIDSAGLSYSVSLHDHSQSWRIVGARIDRQYWHGGTFSEMLVGYDGRAADMGSPAFLGGYHLHGVETKSVVSVYGDTPVAGVYGQAGLVGYGLLLSNVGGLGMFGNHFSPTGDVPATDEQVKAIIIDKDGGANLKVLYPGVDSLHQIMLADGLTKAQVGTTDSSLVLLWPVG